MSTISNKIEQEAIRLFHIEKYNMVFEDSDYGWRDLTERQKEVWRTLAIKSEQRKCQKDQAYFYENYMLVNGQKPILRDRDKILLQKFNRKRK